MPSDATPSRIHIVGATGAVGREALSILQTLRIPAPHIRALASARSVGQRLDYAPDHLTVADADTLDAAPGDLVLLCADAQTSRRLAPRAAAAGAAVIDNSSAFRLDPAVPLIVPEINPQALPHPRGSIIASPNCSTVILLAAVEPLRREFGLHAIDLATYQAVSGAGAAAIDELLEQTRDVLDGRQPRPRVFPEPCAFNLFSHDSPVDPADGLNAEERKIIDESRRILGLPGLRITPTCVRVPVLRAHTQAVTVTLEESATEPEIRGAFVRHAADAGVVVIDDRAAARFPTPRRATAIDPVLVGRIRPDPAESPDLTGRQRRWSLLASADQLRKGAALNLIHIAQRLALLPTPAALVAPAPGALAHRQGALAPA